jgi:hypothetical protein
MTVVMMTATRATHDDMMIVAMVMVPECGIEVMVVAQG